MIIGEGPGSEEERTGAPFCGRSGRLLEGILEELNYPRGKAYITNAVCCRSCVEFEDDGRKRIADQSPSKGALAACRERLMKQIYIVDPLLIVALGAIALKALAGPKAKLAQWLGETISIPVPGLSTKNVEVQTGRKKKVVRKEVVPVTLNYACLVTYHPSYILRNMSTDDHSADSPMFKLFNHLEKAIDLVNKYESLEGRRAV
jgi:uracil-DNA glycosylase family 4